METQKRMLPKMMNSLNKILMIINKVIKKHNHKKKLMLMSQRRGHFFKMNLIESILDVGYKFGICMPGFSLIY